MKLEQPDLIGFADTGENHGSIKQIENAQNPNERKREMRKRGAERPKGSPTTRARNSAKIGSNWGDWLDSKSGGLGDVELPENE